MKTFCRTAAVALTMMITGPAAYFGEIARAATKVGESIEADVCIYGGTSGGVVAAVQAANMGKRAVLESRAGIWAV